MIFSLTTVSSLIKLCWDSGLGTAQFKG